MLSDQRHFHLPVLSSRSSSLVLLPTGSACCSFLHPTISQHPRSRVLMRLDPSFKMSLSILCHPITQPAWYLIACEKGGLGLPGWEDAAGLSGYQPRRAEWFSFFYFLSFFLFFFILPLALSCFVWLFHRFSMWRLGRICLN